MSKPISDRERLILTLLFHKNGLLRGRTRCQKLVYLLRKIQGIEFDYNFMPYHYGPYSRDLQTDLDTLVGLDFIEEEIGLPYNYTLSSAGKKLAKKIEKEYGTESKDIREGVEKLQDISTSPLILTAKSIMREELLREP